MQDFLTSNLVIWTIAAACFVMILLLLFGSKAAGPPSARILADQDDASQLTSISEARIEDAIRRQNRADELQHRMTRAGFHTRKAAILFIGIRVLLGAVPLIIGLMLGTAGVLDLSRATLFGGTVGLAGTLLPSFWLDHVQRSRQAKIRASLPDAMDVMVVCLEGGLSLSAAFSRVARELSSAHPMLTTELALVEQQTRLGMEFAEGLRQFGDRFDLEEIRSMATVINQTERLGASVVSALTVFADTLRMKRQQRAEEKAHKAAVKVIFPTVFCIFPGLFVVVLGPAVIRVAQSLLDSL